MLPYENPLYTEIVVLFSKNQNLCIASHKPLIESLSFKLSFQPETRSLRSKTPHKIFFHLKVNC